jgi:hypothetical protein
VGAASIEVHSGRDGDGVAVSGRIKALSVGVGVKTGLGVQDGKKEIINIKKKIYPILDCRFLKTVIISF